MKVTWNTKEAPVDQGLPVQANLDNLVVEVQDFNTKVTKKVLTTQASVHPDGTVRLVLYV